MATIEKELNRLESEGEDRQLSGQELLVRKKLQEELWAVAQAQESLMRQKAKARWIKEGDGNSKFFHRVVNTNHRSNTLRGVLVNGVWIDEPRRVKEETCLFFKEKFQEEEWVRPKLDGVSFKAIGQQDNDRLLELFTEKEIKNAVWE